ncbi:MAG: phosphatase PAP2 family protein [Ramlibacter sp.]
MGASLPLPRLHPTRAVGLAAVAAVLFAALATDLVLHGPITRTDAPISAWFAAHAEPWMTQLMLAASALHATVPILVYAAGLAAVLVVRAQVRWLPVLLAAVPGGLVLNAVVKLAFHRARPTFDHPLVSLSTFSFPSGQAVGATVWWGFLLVVWFAHEPGSGQRMAACVLAAAMVLLVMLSRIYLGAHYPSDVLAGLCEGTLWLLLCFAAAAALERRRRVHGGGA